MAVDLAEKYGGERSWLVVDCGDGDTFKVLVDPRAYDFDEMLEWHAKIEAAQGPVLTDGEGKPIINPDTGQPKREVTAEAIKLVVKWGSGYILDFDGLTIEGKTVTGAEGFQKLKKYPEVINLVFEKVTEAINLKKASATDSNSGFILTEAEEPAPDGPPVS